MSLDHNAIYKAYPNVTNIDDGQRAKDKDGKSVTLEQSKIDAARVELNKLNYKIDRQYQYPSLEDFADAMYWNSKGDDTNLKAYYAACEKVKSDNPKT